MSYRRQSGFTLLELMITLAVAAILTAMAFPGMRDFLKRNQVVGVSNSIQSDLQLARGEAAARRQYVSICPLSTAGSAACSSSAKSYDSGWLVYTSATAFAAYDSKKDTLEHVAPALTGISVRSLYGGVLTYNARGEFLVSGVADPTGTFITCAKINEGDTTGTSTAKVQGLLLTVSAAGRVASSKIADGGSCS
jgi:type IV fimbrial biogenesis protein FimT